MADTRSSGGKGREEEETGELARGELRLMVVEWSAEGLSMNRVMGSCQEGVWVFGAASEVGDMLVRSRVEGRVGEEMNRERKREGASEVGDKKAKEGPTSSCEDN